MAYLHFFEIIANLDQTKIGKYFIHLYPISFIEFILFIGIIFLCLSRILRKTAMLFELFFKKKSSIKHPKIHHDVSLRSLFKAISWRVVGTLDTIIIAYFITGEVQQALSIGLIEWGTKMILYFFHERAWNQVQWGKK